MAALSSALSRPVATPVTLTDVRVRLIAKKIVDVLRVLRHEGSFAIKLKYSLLAVGGLLRVREITPFALVCSTSSEAMAIADELRPILNILARRSRHANAVADKIKLLSNFIAALEGTGGNGNLLIDTEGLDEEDDN